MPNIAVIGPGAIGGAVTAWLSQDPDNRICICARTPFNRLLVETPQGLLSSLPGVFLDPDAVQPVDWVLIATKAYDVAGAGVWLDRLRGPGTRMAVLQNGVEHFERFTACMEGQFIVPVVVDLPAERLAPGHVRQRRAGRLTVALDRNGCDFARLFQATGLEVATVPDFRSHAWRKLALNCAGAVSALGFTARRYRFSRADC